MQPGRPDHVSLLWPASIRPPLERQDRLGDSAQQDLNVAELARAIVGPDGPLVKVQRREQAVRLILGQLTTGSDVIGYRQETVDDLLESPELAAALADSLPGLEALAEVAGLSPRYQSSGRETVERVGRRLAELELFVDVTRRMAATLASAGVRSTGLRALRAELATLIGSATFAALEAELPGLRATLASVRSVTLGINLGPDLTPESATILGFGTERIEGRRVLLARLMGESSTAHGLTPLQHGEDNVLGRNDLSRDLNRLLQQVAAPVAAALGRYANLSAQALNRLAPELVFLLGGARLANDLHAAGLPTCRPTLLDPAERATELEEAYDPSLALRQLAATGRVAIVGNPVAFGALPARVWVLTGPNRGGKTTFVRSIGLAHVLGQAGLRVAARHARLSPVDAIYTHFPTREGTEPGAGRLDQEAERLAAIFRAATPRSLVLLNEALAGTSSFEAVELARGIVRGLRTLGARALYVTHLHELAATVDEINATTPGDGVVGSLVAEPGIDGPDSAGDRRTRTFRIRPGPPHGRSFAAQIAEEHGISFPRLLDLLAQRGLAPGGPS